MAQENEASVEEILESIKKVIARDNREDALEARRRREEDAERADSKWGDANAKEAALNEPVKSAEVLDLSEMEFVESDDLEDAHSSHETSESDEDPQLTTEAVRNSMRDNFEALAMLSEPGAQPQIVRSGETSLEGLTRELLRPMLAEWLDRNLPELVEKLVQDEISRIAGKRR
ncbi:MAG: DUF2497 domain-containing protein [Erythrobacter sp.]